MSTSNGTSTNGTSRPKPVNGAGVTNDQKSTNAKPELSNLTVVKAEDQKPPVEMAKQPSLQARLKKLAELQNLVDRRELLTEHLDNVNAFDYKSPNANGTIRFTDSKGISFQFSNASVIADCVPMIQAKLLKQIEEVEAQINFTF
jgi:hypothetical protein